jgi:hypothetical protein
MLELWLSVGRTTTATIVAAAPKVAPSVQGIHIDIWSRRELANVPARIDQIGRLWPTKPIDLHSIEPDLLTEENVRHLRMAYATVRNAFVRGGAPDRGLAPVHSVREVASGISVDQYVRSPFVLLVAPSDTHRAGERAELINTALERIRRAATRHDVAPHVVLDRDLDANLAPLIRRDLIEEVVVGKAILGATFPGRSATRIRTAWRASHD